MYFRQQQTLQLLTIEDDFAHLSQVLGNGDLVFQFVYTVSQSDVVKNNIAKCTVTVETQTITKKPLLGTTQKGMVDTRALVNNIRTASIDAKSTQQQQLRYTIATVDSDITAFINNDVIPQLRAQAPVSSIPQFNKSRLVLTSANTVKQNNAPQPVLQRISNSSAVPDVLTELSASVVTDARALMVEMITRQGLDPSYILSLTPRASSAYATHGGLSNTQQAIEKTTDPASQLLNLNLFATTTNVPPNTTEDIVSTDLVQVLQIVSDDTLDIPVNVTIPNAQLYSAGSPVTQVYVTFELVNSTTGMATDSITKILDITKYVQVYYTPRKPPRVKACTSSSSTRVNLEITQVDTGASQVQVYSKNVWTSSAEVDTYTLLGEYALTSNDQALIVQVNRPINSTAIYRVIAVGQQSTVGYEYTNVAIKPARYSPVQAVSLTAIQVDLGIQVETRKIPTNVVGIQILRWNMTTFDQCPTTVNSDVGFVDDSIRKADLMTTIDNDVDDGNIYRYVARLIYKDGNRKDFGEALINFVQPAPGQLNTTVTNLVVSNATTPNVTFNISTVASATNMDMIKQMLGNQGLTDLFTGDVAAQRDELASLVAHSIERVNLNTGERESFGPQTTLTFDDDALSKNQAVKPLAYGHKYRYEIYPLLRAPETMFDDFVKSSVDAVTKKPYTFSPAKYLHPMALNEGTLVTTTGAAQRYAKQPMSFGVIGDITTVEVSFDDNAAQITNATATYFDRYLNVITWGVQGDITQVDSFIIMKQVHGVRSTLGMVHSEFPLGSCQFIHSITNDDVGALQYIIVPIMNDYTLGAETPTNTLAIEEAP